LLLFSLSLTFRRFDGAKVLRIFRVAIKKRLISCSIVATGTRIHDKADECLQNVSQKGRNNGFCAISGVEPEQQKSEPSLVHISCRNFYSKNLAVSIVVCFFVN